MARRGPTSHTDGVTAAERLGEFSLQPVACKGPTSCARLRTT